MLNKFIVGVKNVESMEANKLLLDTEGWERSNCQAVYLDTTCFGFHCVLQKFIHPLDQEPVS